MICERIQPQQLLSFKNHEDKTIKATKDFDT